MPFPFLSFSNNINRYHKITPSNFKMNPKIVWLPKKCIIQCSQAITQINATIPEILLCMHEFEQNQHSSCC